MSLRMGADPNGASYGFEYRGSVLGRFSDSFDLYGAEDAQGYSISLMPLFELQEPRRSHNVLPSQYWRARLSLVQGYTWAFGGLRFRLAAMLTHESDHETAHAYSRPGFVALNDAGMRAQLKGVNGLVSWYVSGDAQLYFLSCTLPSRACENFHGDLSFGGQVQAGISMPELVLWRFAPFAAASFTGIVANQRVIAEHRLLARLGIFARFGDSLLSLFALGSLGNAEGVIRYRTLNVVGAGISFAR